MRRARIQVKPNITKAATKQTNVVKEETVQEASTAPAPPPPVVHSENEQQSEMIEGDNPMNLTVETEKPTTTITTGHHVHFDEDMLRRDGEMRNELRIDATSFSHSPTTSSTSPSFAVPHAARLTPRSRNVSMCEDESILQPKGPKERKRFTGKEELDTKTWKMSDLVHWNPRHDKAIFKRERRTSTSSSIRTKSEINDNFDTPKKVNAPQVKIGADGKLVIDEKSLVMQSEQINHESVWETVEEGRLGNRVTSMSFRTRIFRKSTNWSDRETDLFYEVLQCTGQDFGLMHHYLPQRSRPELKAKYNKEERQNWPRLLNTISHPAALDESLKDRISMILDEITNEAQSKKDRIEQAKMEEKRIRQELIAARIAEREDLRQEKARLLELAKQTRETAKEHVKKQKEEELLMKMSERTNAKLMAMEARKVALEAKQILRESRQKEIAMRADARRCLLDNGNALEKEAEKIIRSLIKESLRNDARKKQASTSEIGKVRRDSEKAQYETIDPMAEGVTLGDTTSEDSSSEEDSDEEALKKKTIEREKARMRAEKRRNLEPRKVVTLHKPVYVANEEPKYAHQPVSQLVEAAKSGMMFDSADDDIECAGPPPPKKGKVGEDREKEEDGGEKERKDEEKEQQKDEEEMEIPSVVTEVVEEIIRERSMTPMVKETSTDMKQVKKRRVVKKKKAEVEKEGEREAVDVEKEKDKDDKNQEKNVNEKDKEPIDDKKEKKDETDTTKDKEKDKEEEAVEKVVEKDPEPVAPPPPSDQPPTSTSTVTQPVVKPPSKPSIAPISRRTIRKPNIPKKK